MASKPQGSSERVLPWQVTMEQLICTSLSHTHYWYEVSMLISISLFVYTVHIIFYTIDYYLNTLTKKTSTRREHKKHNTGTTIQTAKSGFLRTCVQSGPGGRQYSGDAAAQLLCITVVCTYHLNVSTSPFLDSRTVMTHGYSMVTPDKAAPVLRTTLGTIDTEPVPVDSRQ